jgi:hypothetical protein
MNNFELDRFYNIIGNSFDSTNETTEFAKKFNQRKFFRYIRNFLDECYPSDRKLKNETLNLAKRFWRHINIDLI